MQNDKSCGLMQYEKNYTFMQFSQFLFLYGTQNPGFLAAELDCTGIEC